MASWLANLTQAVQGRLESLVDDGNEAEPPADAKELELAATSGTASAAEEHDDSSSPTPLASSSSADLATAGAADLLEQLEQQRSLIDGLKALIREKDSRNQEQEQTIKNYANKDARVADKLGSRIAELERTVEELRLTVHAKEDLIEQLQDLAAVNRHPPQPESHDVSDADELMRSISKKDAAILHLQDRIQELEQKMMDLHELVNEKDQVIHGRDQAVKLMQEQISTRDSALRQAADDHAALKMEFVGLQEKFAAEEAAWRDRLVQYSAAYAHVTEQYELVQKQLLSLHADHSATMSTKDKIITDLQAALERQHVEDASATATTTAACATVSTTSESLPGHAAAPSPASAAGPPHPASDDAKDKELADLKKSLSEQSAKMLKIKAQALAKVKALQKELEEAKQAAAIPAPSAEVSELRNRIAEIEEEKGNLQLQLVDMDEVKTSCAKLTQELALVSASLQQAKAENSDLVYSLDSTRHTMAQMEEATRKAQADRAAEVSSLKDELASLQELREAVAAELDAERRRADLLTTDLHRLHADMAQLQHTQVSADKELTLLRSRLAEADAALTTASEAKVTAELRMAELEEIRDSLLKDKADLVATADDRLQRDQHEAALAAKDAVRERELEAGRSECEAQRVQLRQQADELELLKEQLATAERQLRDSQSQAAAAAAAALAVAAQRSSSEETLLAEQRQLATSAADEAARLRLVVEQCDQELKLLVDEKRRLVALLEEQQQQQDARIAAADAAALAAAQRADEVLQSVRAEHAAREVELQSEHDTRVGLLLAEQEKRCSELERQRDECVAAALEKQRCDLEAAAERHSTDAAEALLAEHRVSLATTVERLKAEHGRAQAEGLAALQRDHDETVAALLQEHAKTLAALQGELDAAVATGRQVSLAAAESNARGAAAQQEQREALEQRVAAYAESQTLLAEQLRVLIDERARSDEAESTARRRLEQLTSLTRAQLVEVAKECHASSVDTTAGLDTSVTEKPTTVEDALLLVQTAMSALRDRLQASEGQLSLMQLEREALTTDKVCAEAASRLPADLLQHASSLLPKEQLPAMDAATGDWCRALAAELDRLHASHQRCDNELKAAAARHTEKLASLASNLQEVESQLSASSAEAEALRTELDACRQRLASAEAAIASQQAATAQQVAAAAAAEHEATLRKYAAVIKKLKAELAAKDKNAAEAHDQSAGVATRLRELLLQSLPPDGCSAVAVPAATHDDSGLDASLQPDTSTLHSSSSLPTLSELTVEQCIDRLQAQLSSARTELAARHEAAARLADELQRAVAGKAAAQEELRQLHDQLHTVHRQSSVAEAELRDRCTDLSSRLEAAHTEVAGRQAECNRLGGLLVDVQSAGLRLQSELDDVRPQLAAAEARSAEAAAQLTASQAKGEKMLAKLRQFKERNDELQSRLDAALARVSSAESEAAAANAAAATQQRLADEAAGHAVALDEVRALAAIADKERQLLENRCAVLAAELETVQAEVRASSEKLAAEAAAAIAARQQLADEAADHTAALAEVQALAAAADKEQLLLKERCSRLAAELETARAEARAVAQSMAAEAATATEAAAAEQQRLLGELDSLASALSSADEELKLLRADSEQLRFSQREAVAEAAECRAQAEALRAEQRSAAAEVTALRSEMEVQRGQRIKLDEQLTASSSKLAALGAAIERLTAERDEALRALDTARRDAAALADERRQLGAALDTARSHALEERLALERRAIDAEEAATRTRLDGEGERAALADQRQSLERRLAETQRQYGMLEADNREFERLVTSLREAKGRLEVEARDLHKRLADVTSAAAAAATEAPEPPTLRRETVGLLGRAAPSQQLLEKEHTDQPRERSHRDVATAVERQPDDVAAVAAATSLATIQQQLTALCAFVSTEAFPELSSAVGKPNGGGAEACIGFLRACLAQLRDRAEEWLAQSAKARDVAAQQHRQQQAMEAAVQQRERECQQLAQQVQHLSSSQQELSYQHGQAMAALQRAGAELQLLRQQQQVQPPAALPADSQGLLVRIAELESLCRRLEKDLDDARHREAEASFTESRSSRPAQKGIGEHSIYMDDVDVNAAATSFDRGSSSSLLPDSAAIADQQLPLLHRAGRLVEQTMPALRSYVRRQASQARRLLRSQPRPQLLLLIYAFLLHVLVLGSCFGNWFCP